MTGIELIAKEREEQISVHGRSVEEDKQENTEYQLTDAAIGLALAVPESLVDVWISSQTEHPPTGWSQAQWKYLLSKPYKERLIIAGAFIAAEIDRIS